MELKWHTEAVEASSLVLPDFNPRTISDDALEALGRDIERFGLVGTVWVDHDLTVLSGNQRVKWLLAKGHKHEMVEVSKPSRPLTEVERKQIMLLGNTHRGEWDFQLLKLEFHDANLSEFNIELPEDAVELPKFDEREVVVERTTGKPREARETVAVLTTKTVCIEASVDVAERLATLVADARMKGLMPGDMLCELLESYGS